MSWSNKNKSYMRADKHEQLHDDESRKVRVCIKVYLTLMHANCKYYWLRLITKQTQNYEINHKTIGIFYDNWTIALLDYLLKGSVPLFTDRRYWRRNSSSKLGCNLKKLKSKIFMCRYEKTDHYRKRKYLVDAVDQ